MQLPLIIGLNIPTKINNFLSRLRISPHSFNKFIPLRNFQFDNSDGFHNNGKDVIVYKFFGGERWHSSHN